MTTNIRPEREIETNHHRLEGKSKPGLVILDIAPAPYRIHVLSRVAVEIPEVTLHSVFLNNSLQGHSWNIDLPPEINPVQIGDDGKYAQELFWHFRHPIRDFRKMQRLIRLVDEENIQAVIVYGYTTYAQRALVRHCHRKGVACFFWADSNIRQPPPKSPVHAIIKRILLPPVLHKCTGIMTMGELGDQYYQRYVTDRDRYFRVPNEPDYDEIFSVTSEEVKHFQKQFDLSPNRRRMICCGVVEPWKRIDLMIDAFIRCSAQRPDWDVVILGDGDQRQELEDRIPDALKNRVKWLGYLQMDEVRVAYHACDMLMFPSDRDAWGLVVNEAMAAGLPVIASDACGAPWDMVRGQGCGEVFPKGDLDALAEVMLKVTDSENYPAYQKAVKPALERWRQIADPVEGIRKALRFAGLIP